MEQKYIKSFFGGYTKSWLVALIMGLIIGSAVASQIKPTYEGAVTFTLNEKPALNQAATPFYLYDGYFSKQAAILAHNGLSTWLLSPKTIHDIYAEAGLGLPNISSSSISRLFKVVEDPNINNGTNTVTLTFKPKSMDDGEKIGQALAHYTKTSYSAGEATIAASDPLILTVDPPRAVITIGIGVALAFLMFLVSLIRHYLKS